MPSSHPALHSDTSPAVSCHPSPNWRSQNQMAHVTSVLWANSFSRQRNNNFAPCFPPGHYFMCKLALLLIYVRLIWLIFYSFSFDFWNKVDTVWLTMVAQLERAVSSHWLTYFHWNRRASGQVFTTLLCGEHIVIKHYIIVDGYSKRPGTTSSFQSMKWKNHAPKSFSIGYKI